MAGLGNKRKGEARKRQARYKPPLDDTSPLTLDELTPKIRALHDVLCGGAQTVEEIAKRMQKSVQTISGLLGPGLHIGLVEHGRHRGEYRLGKRAPGRQLPGDGQSDDVPLLDLLPVDGRLDLAHISARHIIQMFNTLIYQAYRGLRILDPVLDFASYKDCLRLLLDICAELRKWYRVEAEINPGLAVDAVALMIPGLNMPPLDSEGKAVPAETIAGRQGVVTGLLKPLDETKKETPK